MVGHLAATPVRSLSSERVLVHSVSVFILLVKRVQGCFMLQYWKVVWRISWRSSSCSGTCASPEFFLPMRDVDSFSADYGISGCCVLDCLTVIQPPT